MALDFDGGLSPQAAIDRIQAYDIIPNAWYPTFGDSPDKRKFRLIFFLDTLITDPAARNYLMDALFTMYPEADKACKNQAHFFYGTDKRGQVLNPKAISLEVFFSALESDKLKGGARTRNIEAGSEGATFLRKIGENKEPYNSTIEVFKNSTDDHKSDYYEKLKKYKLGNPIDWDKLQNRVRIFYDFMNGRERLSYEQLVGLAQNMVWMNGGPKVFEERLHEFNDAHKGNNPYPKDGRFELIRKMKKYNKRVDTAYFPQRLENFSPYSEDHKYRNLITAERDLIDGIERTGPINRIPLEKAEKRLEYKFTQALDSKTHDIFIFRLPTGIGKTWRVKDLNKVTLAFPTNDLKKQVFEERKLPESAIMTPEFPVFTDNKLNKSIDRLYKAGFVKQVHRLLWDLKKGIICSPEDQVIAQTYINENQAVQNSVRSIFTTHSRAIHSSFSHNTIVFDEDPLSLILEVETLKIADLKKIKKNKSKALLFGDDTPRFITLQRYLESVEEGEILTLPDEFKVDITNDWLLIMQTEGIDSNIIKFLDCAYFYKDESDRDLIHFINQEKLPEDKKIIIMSATIPVEIYQELYGERVQVIDITDVVHKGTITQHTKYSYSRNSLAKHLDEANAKLSKRPTITFKSFNDQIEHAAPEMWFGNCSGYNQYTGKSINVLGCPHKHNALYLLIGKVLGVNVDRFNREFKMQTVEWGGFRFSFNTFDNQRLQTIQLSLIESELIQAAGRARALREDAEVDIYANLPLRISQTFVDD